MELKSLETDTSPKIESEMERHRTRDEFPLFFGEVEVSKVLKHLPDGDQINERIFLRTTRSVEGAMRSAEDQINNTARLFDLKESVGIMVLLNQGVQVLTPEAVGTRVAKLIRRKNEDGSPRSPIAYVWMLFESHTVANGPTEKSFPMIALEGPLGSAFPWFRELFIYLRMAWATFNGAPLLQIEPQQFSKLDIVATPLQKQYKPGDKIKRQQLWELQYHQGPYLRALTDEEVFSRGRETIEKLTPHYIVGGTKIPNDQLWKLEVAWSDFLCEARHRGLDLRRMGEIKPP